MSGGGFTIHFPEAEVQEAFTDGTDYYSTMYLIHNMEAGGLEGGTGFNLMSNQGGRRMLT